MKKLIFLPPSFLLLVLMVFFSCSKQAEMPTPTVSDAHPNVTLTQGPDGILNVKVTPKDAPANAVVERGGEELCTMYEALRFTEYTGQTPDSSDTRVYVQIQFRLVKVSKSNPSSVTPLTDYIYAGYTSLTGVGGLNITWFEYPPLSDYWYTIEIYNCQRKVPVLGNQTFVINDFWHHNYMVQLAPWSIHIDYEPLFGPITNGQPESLGALVTLLEDCTLSAD